MFGKIVKLILRLLLPKCIYDGAIYRWEETKKVMKGTPILNIFWKIVLTPLNLIFSLAMAMIKVVLIWLFGRRIYPKIRYGFNLLFEDLTSASKTRRKTLPIALKRQKMFYELVIKGRERHISCGDKNPDITFYVIRPYYYLTSNLLNENISHLMFYYYRNLQYIAYALDKGWVPVVDWENYGQLRHMENYPINGTKNGWEYFWNQPSPYTLDEVYQSKNVVLGVRNQIDTPFMPRCDYPRPYQKNAENCVKSCVKYDRFISFNEYTEKHIIEMQNLLFPVNACILGVSVRGTSYGAYHIANHPEQPQVEELLQMIHKHMEDWNMTHVFFACELNSIVDAVKNEFGDAAIVLPRIRYDKEPNPEDNPLYEPGHKYQTNLDYVTEMALLSRCNALLAAYSGGVRVAVIWNRDRYEHMKII